jgi:hypothetical protein
MKCSALGEEGTNMQQPNLRQLSGPQLWRVLEAAQQLHPRAREPFLQAVAAVLVGHCDVGDGDVARVVRDVLQGFHGERSVTL